MKCQRRTDVSYGNPVVADKEQNRIHGLHRQRVANVRSGVDNSCPPSHPHLTTFGRDYFWKKKRTVEAAFSDLKMIQSIARTMTRPLDVPSNKGPTSLNANFRKQELFRITMDNHKLLNRLENAASQSTFSTKRLEECHLENRRHMANASYESSARKAGYYDALLRPSMCRSTPDLRRNQQKMLMTPDEDRPPFRGQEQEHQSRQPSRERPPSGEIPVEQRPPSRGELKASADFEDAYSEA